MVRKGEYVSMNPEGHTVSISYYHVYQLEIIGVAGHCLTFRTIMILANTPRVSGGVPPMARLKLFANSMTYE